MVFFNPKSKIENPKCKGFTLIELLVVVAIIAVLVAILLPALGNARGQARKVACLSNFRQISLGVQMYSDRYAEWAPFTPDGYGVWTYAWGYAGYTGYTGLGLLWSEKFINDGRVFQCTEHPGFTPASTVVDQFPDNGITRTFLWYLPAFPRPAISPFPSLRSRTHAIAARALVTEEPSMSMVGWWTPGYGVHANGFNVLYGDGSAEFRISGKPTNGSVWPEWHVHELDRYLDY